MQPRPTREALRDVGAAAMTARRGWSGAFPAKATRCGDDEGEAIAACTAMTATLASRQRLAEVGLTAAR
jgi:hypothetical protein